MGDLSGRRNHGSMQRGTSSSCSSCTVTVPDRSEYYYKDISLLCNSSYDQVPRGSAKVSLLEDGLHLDPSELDISRGEARLNKLVALFEHVLKRPDYCRRMYWSKDSKVRKGCKPSALFSTWCKPCIRTISLFSYIKKPHSWGFMEDVEALT